jgi:hypothetical protein
MTADIVNSKINRVLVEGNGESLYFALDDKTNMLMGMNKIICSNIIVRFKEGRVNNLSFYVKPEANFIPPHELKKENLTLKGYSWKLDEKPTRNDVVNYEEKPVPVEKEKNIDPKKKKVDQKEEQKKPQSP